MFTLILRLKRRLKKLLKVQTESRQLSVVSVRTRAIRGIILILAAITAGILYPGEVLYDPLDMPRRDEFAPEDIRAPFQITVYKSDREIRQEQDDVRLSIPYIINYDTTVVNTAIEGLKQFILFADSLKVGDSVTRAVEYYAYYDSIARRFPLLSQSAIKGTLTDTSGMAPVGVRLEDIYRTHIYRVGVLSELDELHTSRNRTVIVRKGDEEYLYDRGRILDITRANAVLTTVLNQQTAKDSFNVDLHYSIGRSFILPNLVVDIDEYEKRVQAGLDQLSEVRRIVETNDVIVSARDKVSPQQEEILQEMVRMMRSRAASKGWWMPLAPVLARILIFLTALGALYLFLFTFRPEIFYSNQKLFAILLIYGLQLFFIYAVDQLAIQYNISSNYIYPVVILPVMITILFDAEVGLLTTVTLAILLGIMHRFSFSMTLLVSVVGIVGCMSSRKVRKRSDFYRIMLWTVLACILLILVVENLKLSPNQEIITDIVVGLSMAVLSVMTAMGLLPIFESLFGIVTTITLLELSDLNHPLLKRLSIEAPGTYHHSIAVGNLSESAAEVIGANALLARVGCYYHDIGKIEVPEYFIENQFSIKSKHDSLTPTMSSLILGSHVKNGRVLGEEANIPDEVLNFIEEHHGTMVMSYFYHRAKELSGEDVDENKFRYPGPKPQVRETGIAMLADAVEAASRTLDEPKPSRIDSLIQKIINDRFQSGELDECPLTLRDLAGIKKAFSQVLIAAFHHRVKYPAGPQA